MSNAPISDQTPLVSIIVTAYNAQNYIGQAIESVLAQTYPHLEVIVVNDGSTDETESVILSYKDERIRYVASSHGGSPSRVRNAGLPYAKGEFITFFDGDDAYFPTAIEALLKPMLENPDQLMSMGFPYYCNDDLEPLYASPHLEQPPQTPIDGPMQFARGYNLCWEQICQQKLEFYVCSSLFRRSVVDEIGSLDANLTTGDDFKFICSVFSRGFERVALLPRCIYRYRNYLGSNTKNPQRVFNGVRSHEAIVDWLFSLPSLPEACQAYRGQNIAARSSAATRTLINLNRRDLAGKLLWRSLFYKGMSLPVWLKAYYKVVLRWLLPGFIDNKLMQVKKQREANTAKHFSASSGLNYLSWLIYTDLYRYEGLTDEKTILRYALFNPGFQVSCQYRLMHYLFKNGPKPLLWLLKLWYRFVQFFYGFEINYRLEIGPGFVFQHVAGTFLNCEAIGQNFQLMHGVTIGATPRGSRAGRPTVGNNVFVGPGAVVIGNIKLGDGCAIGANSVVTTDVPENAVVAGNPGKIISYKGSTGYVEFTDYEPA